MTNKMGNLRKLESARANFPGREASLSCKIIFALVFQISVSIRFALVSGLCDLSRLSKCVPRAKLPHPGARQPIQVLRQHLSESRGPNLRIRTAEAMAVEDVEHLEDQIDPAAIAGKRPGLRDA